MVNIAEVYAGRLKVFLWQNVRTTRLEHVEAANFCYADVTLSAARNQIREKRNAIIQKWGIDVYEKLLIEDPSRELIVGQGAAWSFAFEEPNMNYI